MDRHCHATGRAAARDRRGGGGADHGSRSAGQVAAGAGDRHQGRGHGLLPGHAHGLCPAAGVARARARTRIQAPRSNRHSLPGLCAAGAGGRTRPGAALRHRHAVLRQHDDREIPRVSRAAVRSSGNDHLSGVSRRLSRRAAICRRAAQGNPLPATADLEAGAGFLPAHMPHLRRLHQCACRHYRGLHGRRRRAMAAGAQRAAARNCSSSWWARSMCESPAAPASGTMR